MTDRTAALEPLICDLLDWLSREPRSRAETLEAWRTSCPRLTVWEDTVEAGLVERRGADVAVTELGAAFLAARRGAPAAGPAQPRRT